VDITNRKLRILKIIETARKRVGRKRIKGRQEAAGAEEGKLSSFPTAG